MRLTRLAAPALALLLSAACGSGGSDPSYTIEVDPASAELVVGETQQVTATLRTTGGDPVSGATYSWSSSATSVATVSTSGLISAVAPGSAVITVSSAGESDEVAVTVVAGNSLEVSATTAALIPTQTRQLTATLRDGSGAPVAGASYAWSSSASGVATVSPSGFVTAVGVGAATITVASDGLSRDVAVTVVVPTVRVTPDTIRIFQGLTQQLAAEVLDASGAPFPGATISWTVSGSGSTISASGLVTATGGGVAQARASFAGGADSTPVYSTGVAARLTLDNSPFGVAVGMDSVVVATQLYGAAVARSRTDQASFGPSVPVGIFPTDIAVSGTRAFVTNQGSQSLGIVDLLAGSQSGTVPITGDPFRVLVTPDGGTAYVTANTDSLYVVDTQTGSVTGRLAVGSDPNGIALRAAANRLYLSHLTSGDLVEVNTQSLSVVRTIPLGGVPQEVVVSPDETELYVANESLGLQVVNLGTGAVTTYGGVQPLFGMALSPDGRRLYATGGGRVVVIDRATRGVLGTVPTGGGPRRIRFDRLGTMAVVANEAGWVDFIR